MAAVAALLSLCFGALSPCPSGAGPRCSGEVARGLDYPGDIAVSTDDKYAAVAATRSGLYVYNVATGVAVTVPLYSAAMRVAFSPDSNRVAVAVKHRGVAVVSLSSGTELWSDVAGSAFSNAACISVAYSPDGTRVASGHRNGRILIWNAATGALVLSLTGGHGRLWGITGLAFTLDGGRLVSGSYDKTVIVWDATTGAVLKTLTDHTSYVYDVQVSPDGLYFASVGTYPGDAVSIYKLSDYSLHKQIVKQSHTMRMSFSQDWSKVVLVGRGDMTVYTVESGNLLQSDSMPSADTGAVSYFHKSDAIITCEYVDVVGILLWDYVPATAAPPTPSPPPPPPPTPSPPTPAPPTPATPAPCSAPTDVVTFASSTDFVESVPLTFGGEFYARATVVVNSYTLWGRVFDFANGAEQDNVMITQVGTTGQLALSVSGGSFIACTRPAPLGQAFTMEAKVSRIGASTQDGWGVLYIDGVECANGAVRLPAEVTRTGNYIGHSHWAGDAPLDGTVSNFVLSRCPQMLAPPCSAPTDVVTFASSTDFVESSPLTFGGEFYVRATVVVNSYTLWGRVFDFANGAEQDNVMITQVGTTGELALSVSGGSFIACTRPAPLGQAFTIEAKVSRIGASTQDGWGVLYIDGVECATGAVRLPAQVTRTGNYIGDSHWAGDAPLDGTVSNFVLSRCPQMLAPPCSAPTDVVTFASSTDFVESAPLTFGGEFYVRATVVLNNYISWGRVFDFANEAGGDNVMITQVGTAGQLALSVSGGSFIACTLPAPLGQAFTIEAKVSRIGASTQDGWGVLYIDGVECATGAVRLPAEVTRTGDFIGHSHWNEHDGTVSNFVLSRCPQMLAPPCSAPTDVVTFASSTDFVESSPLTFGGEFYVRATVVVNSYTLWGRVFDFANGAEQDNVMITQVGTTGQLALSVSGGSFIACTRPAPLGQAFTMEAKVSRIGASTQDGWGVLYIDGVECATGAVRLPAEVTRTGNYIGHSHWAGDAPLDGTVSNFHLSMCQ